VSDSATPASAPSTAGAATEAPNEVPATPMEVVSQKLNYLSASRYLN
jgi:hypothetical protein